MAIGEPVDDRAADARNGADAAADPGAAHDQPHILEAVLHALPLALVDALLLAARGNGEARDQKVAELGQGEDAEQHRRQRQAVPQIEAIESPAQGAGLRIGTDHRQHDAGAARGQPAQRRVARQDRDHRDAEHRESQKLRRAQIQHDRAQDRNGEGQQYRAEDTAEHRRHVGRAQRAAGFAALGHRKAVEHGRRRGGAAGHAEQHGWNRIACRRGGAKAKQHRKGAVGIHRIGEGQQHRRSGKPADARYDAEHHAHDAAEAEESQPVRLHQQSKGLPRRIRHIGSF